MKKPQLYLETSVWNFYFAEDAPEKNIATINLFQQIQNEEFEVFISEIVIREIGKAKLDTQHRLFDLIDKYQPILLELIEANEILAKNYIQSGVLPNKSIEDARHAAIASTNQLDALISWNMKHLANLKKMQMINAVNLKYGYMKRIELITPMEVSESD